MTTLRQLKVSRKAFYKSIVSVNCPILGETVYFTSQGFNHLINESHSLQGVSRPRAVNEQFLKLQLLAYAPDVIKKSVKVGEIRKAKKMFKGLEKEVTHYELIHDFGQGTRVAVIVEKVGDTGKHKFLSVKSLGAKKRRTK